MANAGVEDMSEIVFFDVETRMPSTTWPDQGYALLEFGAILVCPTTLVELDSYSTLICPEDPSRLTYLSDRGNGISKETVASAPRFADVADRVYNILHRRIWAGHNILKWDCVRIKEAFDEIGRPAPVPKGTFDSLPILTQKFGRRAGNMELDSLATHFGLGKQPHRSLDDVRLNIEVVKRCATVLFMEQESSLPDIKTDNLQHDVDMEEQIVTGSSELLPQSSGLVGSSDDACFLDPDEVSIPSISVEVGPFNWGYQRLSILHELKLRCSRLRVRFGLKAKFLDHAGRPRLNFVVDVAPNICRVLEACDDAALKQSVASGSDSEWRPVVERKNGYNSPIVRLHLPTPVNGEMAMTGEEIYRQDTSGAIQKLTFNASNAGETELGALLKPGTTVDAYVSLELYDYKKYAGIKLVAKKLIIHCT